MALCSFGHGFLVDRTVGLQLKTFRLPRVTQKLTPFRSAPDGRGLLIFCQIHFSAKQTKASFRTSSAEANVLRAASADVSVDGDIPSTQEAWFYEEYGDVERLQSGSFPVPTLADDQVLVKVRAAALNPLDSKRRHGRLKKSDSPFPTVPCYDMAGTVVATGSKASLFKKGAQVFGQIAEFCLDAPKQCGTIAQYTAVEEHLLAPKPRNLTFTQAAALPLVVLTGYQCLKEKNVTKGESVLVLNGAGGVGIHAVQIAKHVLGAGFVAATASSSKAELLRELGVDLVIDYKSEDFTARPERYDFVLDCIGECERALKVLKDGGREISITGAITPPGERYVIVSKGQDLRDLVPYFESGTLRPILDPTSPYTFDNVRDAFSYLESGRATGKVVVEIS